MNAIALVLFVLITTSGTSVAQTGKDTIQWLTESSYDLQTTNPYSKITDIPFYTILENVEMVLVGEATHGTKEFAEIKHRLFRHLVENLGFRYFFVEADFAAGLLVDQYICGKGGDAVDVLKGLRFFHIVNEEGLELIKWMKSHNETKSPNEKIRFFGIDCQTSENAFTQLKGYFHRVDSAFSKVINGIRLENHRPTGRLGVLDRKYPVLTLSQDTILILKDRLLANKAIYLKASSEMEYKIAQRLLEVLLQSSEIIEGNYNYHKREESMAANIVWALDEIDPQREKAFLWAHNHHVMYGEITEAKTGKSLGTLGNLLRDMLDRKVYSIGIEFNQGSFVASEIQRDTIVKRVWTVSKAPRNTFPYLLSRTCREVLFMDFHSFQNEELVMWLRRDPVKGHNITAVYYPAYRFRPYFWLQKFDGLIFINKTHEITLDFH